MQKTAKWTWIKNEDKNQIAQLLIEGYDLRAFNEIQLETYGFTVTKRPFQKADFNAKHSRIAAGGYAALRQAKIAARRALRELLAANAASALDG